MALLENSYGSVAGVAAIVPRFAGKDGKFDSNTRPSLDYLETLINQVSSILNVIFSEEGFSIPITQSDAVLMCDFFVIQEAASIVEGINGSGRFGPQAKGKGASRFGLIHEDAKDFVMGNANGFINLGVEKANEEVEVGDFATSPVAKTDAWSEEAASDTDYSYDVDLYIWQRRR